MPCFDLVLVNSRRGCESISLDSLERRHVLKNPAVWVGVNLEALMSDDLERRCLMAEEVVLLTAREVAGRLRVSERTVQRLARGKKFPSAFKAGRAWRIPLVDVEEYIRKQRSDHHAEA